MGKIEQFAALAMTMQRSDVEAIAQALVAIQRASAEAAAILLDRLDQIDGDPDAEPSNDLEDDFVLSASAVEIARMCPSHDRVDQDHDGLADDEEDDAPGQCTEDEISTDLHAAWAPGAGCELSDPGGCQHDGREPEHGY
jgi:hypothetical protein